MCFTACPLKAHRYPLSPRYYYYLALLALRSPISPHPALGALLLAQGSFHSLCIYFLPVYSMTTPGKDGLFEDWVMVGCTVYTGIIVTVNLKVGLGQGGWGPRGGQGPSNAW